VNGYELGDDGADGGIMFHFRGLCLGVLVILLAADPACPQGIRRGQKNQPQKAPQFNLSGTLDGIEGNALRLTTGAGYAWILRPAPKVQIHLSGKAVPAFLAPGQAIAFFAKLDTRRGATVEAVRRLIVFTPNEKRPFGIQPDLGFGDLEKETFGKLQQTEEPKRPDGKPPVSEAESISSSGAPATKQGKHAAKRTPPQSVDSFIVRGKILSVKKGELLVGVPNNGFVKKPTLIVEVAEDADITVDLVGPPALLVLVQPGDHVQASGDQTGEGRGDARDLRVRTERLLGVSPEAKKPSRARVKKSVSESKTP
jgi:hypothetical protein